LFLGVLALGLAATKDRWFPRDLSREWNNWWLSSKGGAESDPRAEILAGHRRRLKAMEREYQERIDREKKLHQIYLLEYERLSGQGNPR